MPAYIILIPSPIHALIIIINRLGHISEANTKVLFGDCQVRQPHSKWRSLGSLTNHVLICNIAFGRLLHAVDTQQSFPPIWELKRNDRFNNGLCYIDLSSNRYMML